MKEILSMKDNSNDQKKIISSLLWRFAERCGAQGVSFIVSILLARLLLPKEYGEIALVLVIINILQVFVDSGLGNALIQKKDADETDFSTVFWFNVVFCVLLYVGLYAAAPVIETFYRTPHLTSVIRVLGLNIVISSLKNVQQAFVSRNLMFKKFFFATLGGTIGAGILGIALAYLGAGIWALVAQQLFNATVDTLILWLTVQWRPKWLFSWERIKSLWKFGFFLLLANLINTIYLDIRQLIIGKLYSSEDLAYYNRGKQIPDTFANNITAAINSVLFPVMSKQQTNPQVLKTMMQKAICVTGYVIWPVMIGIIAMGENFICVLLTEKWRFVYPFLCISCLVKGFEPIHTANLNAIQAMGRTDITLKLEITKKTIGLIVIFIFMRISVLALACSGLLYTVIAGILNALPNKRLMNYPLKEQIADLFPNFLLSMIMGLCVYAVGQFVFTPVLRIVVQIVLGGIVYLSLSIFTQNESFVFLVKTLGFDKKFGFLVKEK